MARAEGSRPYGRAAIGARGRGGCPAGCRLRCGRPGGGPASRLTRRIPSTPASAWIGGRTPGSLDNATATAPASQSGSPRRSGGSVRMRWTSASSGPLPNGVRPVAANSATQPQPQTSAVAAAGLPPNCSGAIHSGVPMTVPTPVNAVRSPPAAMPRSTSTGPRCVRMMLPGLTSRWTSRCRCSAASASASPSVRWRSCAGPSGTETSASDGPGHVVHRHPGPVGAGVGGDEGRHPGVPHGGEIPRLAGEPIAHRAADPVRQALDGHGAVGAVRRRRRGRPRPCPRSRGAAAAGKAPPSPGRRR